MSGKFKVSTKNQYMKTKQLTLILLVLTFPLGAWCQLEKGSYLGSADAGFAFSTQKDVSNGSDNRNSTLDFSLNSGFGIFVINRLAIGPGFDINAQSTTYKSTNVSGGENKDNITTYSLSFDPFVRYYFFSSGKIALFGQASAMIGYGQNFYKSYIGTPEEAKETTDILNYGGKVLVGFVYFITPNVGLETSLGYQFGGEQFKDKEFDTIDKSTNGELALNAGLSIYLGKCKKEEKKEKNEKEEKKE
jgi:hypothetical protein